MRISDWSSDVCSSDLAGGAEAFAQGGRNDGPGSQFVRQLAARKTLALCAEDRDPVGVVDVEEEVVAFLKTHQRLERRSEEHTSELQSLMRIPYADICLKNKKRKSTYLESSHYTTSH